tara:strand:+ start:6410 stop:7237 length:828 start_codon:yes stop_codon:yes gene_type:complete
MKDQSADKRTPIIAGALLLTLTLLGVFGWLLASTEMPADCPSGLWLLNRLGCLSPNELGDTFAGAFAPVAFVWLVAAVMLQRNELAAQRQELRETREVAEAQVVEARNNVAFMGEQTKLLRLREEVERKAQQDDELRAYIEALNDLIEASLEVVKVARRQDDGFGNEGYFSVVPLTVSGNPDPLKRLQSYAHMLSKCSIEAYRVVEERSLIHYTGIEELKRIEAHFEAVSAKSNQVSDALQIRCQIVDSDNASWRIGLLIKLLEEQGQKIPETDY